MKKKTIGMAAAALAMLAAAGADGILYRGNVESLSAGFKIDEGHPLHVEFRLYGSATGKEVLWGKEVALKVDAAGNFATTLGDDTGSGVAGGARFEKLSDALEYAFAGETGANQKELWIGLTPQDCTEVKRDRVGAWHAANKAAATLRLDRYAAPKISAEHVATKGGFTLKEAKVGAIIASGGCRVTAANGETVDGDKCKGRLTFTGKLSGVRQVNPGSLGGSPGDIYEVRVHDVPNVGTSYSTMIYAAGTGYGNGASGTAKQTFAIGGK